MKAFWKKGLLLLAAGVFALGMFSRAEAGPVVVPEKINAVMIGDRLVDVALNLGVLPRGMSVRCSMWPKCRDVKLASQVLGCPKCLIDKQPKKLAAFMREQGINRLILEKSSQFCLYRKIDPLKAAGLVKDLPGVSVEYVDFTGGVADAIRQAAALLGREARGEKLAESYGASMKKVEQLLPSAGLGKRVVVLNGVYSPDTGKSFIRVEAPGGYTDQYILTPLGCTNAAGAMIPDSVKISKGHTSSRKLAGLLKASPDVIAITGNGYAVQQALHKAVAADPRLGEIPALRNGAVFTLPFYGDSSVIEYPQIFRQWAAALGNE